MIGLKERKKSDHYFAAKPNYDCKKKMIKIR